jgi:phospholipid/cholesterol/gamma-HCH transport system substrate-binding protein
VEKSHAKSDTIVGLFVLTAFAVLLFATFTIRGNFAVKTVQISATFEAVSGLEEGAPVLINGVRKGRVTSIRFDPRRAAREARETGATTYSTPPVTVRMVIAEVPMYPNAVVRLAQQGFIGDRRVEIDPGSPERDDEPPIADLDGYTFVGQPVFDMARVFARAEGIVTDLEVTLSSFREFVTADETAQGLRQSLDNLTKSMQKAHDILEHNEANVAEFIANSRAASEDLRQVASRTRELFEADGTVDRLAGESEAALADIRAQFNEIASNARTSLESVNQTIARFDERGERLTTSAVDLMDAAKNEYLVLTENLERSRADLEVIIGRIRRGEGTLGRILTDPQPFEDLKDSIETLRNFLGGSRDQFYQTTIPYQPRAADRATSPSNG